MPHLTENTLLMGRLDWDMDDGFKMAPARIESAFPNGFRMAQYPDGSLRMQGAYIWSQGKMGGITWKDLPLVQVGEDGQVTHGD